MRVECKGASIEFYSKVIIITTPKPPAETWEGRCEEDIRQLERRIFEVRHFPGEPVIPALFVPGFVPP